MSVQSVPSGQHCAARTEPSILIFVDRLAVSLPERTEAIRCAVARLRSAQSEAA